MRNAYCMGCTLCHKTRLVCLWGEGATGTIMLVTGATTYTDAFHGHSLWGEAGDLLDHILFKLGYGREAFYVTSLLKCSPGKEGLPKGKGLTELVWACSKYLNDEIIAVKPKVIVPMGSLAAKHLAQVNFITRAEGFPLEGCGHHIVPCHAPSAALQAPGTEKNIAMALAKALELAGMPVKSRGEGLIFNYKDMGGLD